MDPGTALSVASLTYDITKDLYEYYRAWKDCDKDVEELRVQLLWLHNAFEVSRDIVRKPDLSAQAVNLVCSALGGCNNAANELRDILDKIKKQGAPQSVLDKLKACGRRACYPFRKSTVTAIVEQVESCSDELQLAVDLLQLDTTTHAYHTLQELDTKLVNGFDGVDNALKQLPTIVSEVSLIKDETRSLKTGIEHARDFLRNEKDRATMQTILDWLCTADYSQQQNDFYQRRQNGTGVWFLDSPKFDAWVRGTEHTLVCPGHPGAGKTIIAATVINRLLQTKCVAGIGVIYLFCNYKRQGEQVTTHLLGALARQLVYTKANIPAPIVDMYTHHRERNTRPSQEELKKALLSLIQILTRVYVVIDALDECQKETRTQIVSTIGELQVHSHVHLLATTRPLPEILEQFAAASMLEIRASNHDVDLYIRGRMAELPRCVQESSGLQDRVVTTIVTAVDGMFLLAKLHMDSLKDKRRIKSVKLALERLPQGSDTDVYNQAYSDAMERICSQPKGDAALAKEALSWIVRAQRPLKVTEFQHALAVEVDTVMSGIDKDNFLSIDEIASLCAGLVSEDEQSGIVRLVHYTTQRFLEQTWLDWLPDAETTIALKCVKYLSYNSFLDGPCYGDEELEERLVQNPLFEYSAKYWGVHVSATGRQAATKSYELLQDSTLCFLRNADLVLSATQAMLISSYRWKGYASNYPGNTQGPHLVARFGAEKLMEALLKADFGGDCWDSSSSTPLLYAARSGHVAVVKLLLGTGQVEIDSKDGYGRTPLSYAAGSGHEAVVKLLLGTGQVEVDSKDRNGRTPLSYAARSGHEAVVKLLLGTGQVEIDSKDGDGRTPLSYAARSGHEAVVKLLLGTGQVEVDSKDGDGRTPLWYAARSGHEAVVKLLLGTGQVEIDSKDGDGRTPLSYAAGSGHEAVVKLLLGTGQVEVDSKDGDGRTPLSYAAGSGHEAVVKLLLGTGQVEVDSKDRDGRTPLSYAAGSGHEAVVKLLLGTGQVEVDSKDRYGRTPLWYAARSGHEAVVKLLLGTGQVEVDSKDGDGRTPLSFAARSGHEAVVKLLLGTGQVEVDSKDGDGRTSLWYAADSGHEAVVKLLLGTGQVEVDSKDRDGRTPLSYAAENGHEAVIKLLDAVMNERCCKGLTPNKERY